MGQGRIFSKPSEGLESVGKFAEETGQGADEGLQSSTCKGFSTASSRKGSLSSFHLLPSAPLKFTGSCPTPKTNTTQSTKHTSRRPPKGQPPEPAQALPRLHQQGQGLTRTIKWSASCSFTGVKGCPFEICSDGLHVGSGLRSSGVHPGLHQAAQLTAEEQHRRDTAARRASLPDTWPEKNS